MVKGEILLNNRPIGQFMHRLSGFVHQDDLFDGNLTVLEHLTFIVSIGNLKLEINKLRERIGFIFRQISNWIKELVDRKRVHW